MSDTRERAQQELLLHLTLGASLQATRGFSSPEEGATYTRAQELSHPFSLAFAQVWAAWVHQYCRERYEPQAWTEATISLSTDQGFPQWLAIATIFRGKALAEQGQSGEGITQMRQSIAAQRAIFFPRGSLPKGHLKENHELQRYIQ